MGDIYGYLSTIWGILQFEDIVNYLARFSLRLTG